MNELTSRNRRIYTLQALTGLHIGCGQGQGDVDLPVTRGKGVTRPIVPGTSLKGALREAWQGGPAEKTWLFGPERDDPNHRRGALIFDDARLLLLPVASMAGGWAWVSTADTLRRFARDVDDTELQMALIPGGNVKDLAPEQNHAWVGCHDSPLKWQVGDKPLLMLHDFLMRPNAAALGIGWHTLLARRLFPDDSSWQKEVADRLVVVSDTVMDALCDLALDVRSRVSLNDDRVAQGQALWREELVPNDAVFWGMVAHSPVGADKGGHSTQHALSLIQPQTLQLGGKATVGHGWVRFAHLMSAESDVGASE